MKTQDFSKVIETVQNRQRIMTSGTVEETIALAKEVGINAPSRTSVHKATAQQLKQRLIELGVDPETI
jgi:hypothetical protein